MNELALAACINGLFVCMPTPSGLSAELRAPSCYLAVAYRDKVDINWPCVDWMVGEYRAGRGDVNKGIIAIMLKSAKQK